MKNKIQKSNGYTLLEVLIALIVLSVGLLGTAGLQTQTQKFSREAYINTQATVFAHDILERARANPQGVASGFYNLPNSLIHDSCYSLAGCSTKEMAENDMFEWHTAMKKAIPGGRAIICIDSTPDDGIASSPACDGAGLIYAAKVWWASTDSTTERIVITTSL